MTRPVRVAALVLVCVAATASHAELRFEWTAKEVACASSIGIDLDKIPVPSQSNYARHMTWLADVVAVARVANVVQDGRGPYLTVVELELVASRKGSVASTLYVDLHSGPHFSELRQQMIESHLVGEPRFVKDEQVVVFLTTSYDRPPEDPESFAHAANHYSVLAKWRITGETASPEETPSASVPRTDLESDIELARKTQAGCR